MKGLFRYFRNLCLSNDAFMLERKELRLVLSTSASVAVRKEKTHLKLFGESLGNQK